MSVLANCKYVELIKTFWQAKSVTWTNCVIALSPGNHNLSNGFMVI